MVSFANAFTKYPGWKLKQQWPYFLLVFAVPVLAILWWWGLFSKATVEVAERGPYHYAYLAAKGPYSKLAQTHAEVDAILRQQKIAAGKSVTLILDDPRTTPTDERRARTGFLIPEDAAPAQPLLTDSIPARRVISVKVRAHPIFAYGKAYGALLDYMQQQHLQLQLPTLEIYDASILTVEMPLENNL